MPSYQDIEVRLAAVERKLDWFMRQMRVQTKTPLGTTDESLLDAYHRQNSSKLAADAAKLARDRAASKRPAEAIQNADPGDETAPNDGLAGGLDQGWAEASPVSGNGCKVVGRPSEESFEQLRTRLRAEGII